MKRALMRTLMPHGGPRRKHLSRVRGGPERPALSRAAQVCVGNVHVESRPANTRCPRQRLEMLLNKIRRASWDVADLHVPWDPDADDSPSWDQDPLLRVKRRL